MECIICTKPYNKSSRKPKNLPCGHTYCAECLTKLMNQSATATIKCPKDRKECEVPGKQIEQLAINFALLDMLPDDCVDCHEKPQDGPCLPEHCSKRLCSDCKTSHLKEFSVELVADLQAMKKYFSEQQAMCDDDTELTKMVDQSKAVIAEVTRVFDAEKDKLIDVIRKNQASGSSNYVQWRNNLNHCLARSRFVDKGFVDKVLSEIKQTADSKSGKFLSDVKKQLTQEKEAISGVEDTKEQLHLFDASDVQKIFDGMMPALYVSVMPFLPDYTAAQFSQSYGKKGSGAGEVHCPFGVASSPVTGNLAVSDCYNHRIQILTADLTPVRVIGTVGSGERQFDFPTGVCFSSTDSLFIADQYRHCIKQVNEDGGHIRTFGRRGEDVGQFQYPQGICCEDGLLYVCDRDNSRTQVMRESGQHVLSIGSPGKAPGQFSHLPWFIAASAQHDKLVVSDHSGDLYFFSLEGRHRKTIRAGEPPYNIKAQGVMIDELGQVIVSDRKEGCLVVLGENNVITTIRMPAGERMGDPRDVTMTSDGSIIVCDFSEHQLHKFTVPRQNKSNTSV